MDFFKAVVVFLRAFLVSRASLAAENVALRQQLNVLQRTVKRPKLRWQDRLFWVWLSRLWAGWRACLMLVKPETVIHWHRQGFKLYWRWKSKAGKAGRPKTDAEIRDLIRRMSSENVAWGAPRIQSELQLLGYTVAKATVAKYMVKHPKPPSQNWRTFLDNHVRDIVAIDFFTVPTLTFGILYGFLVLRHDRREVIHFNVTTHPTAQWTAQQIVEAFPWDEAPRYLLRDRDAIFSVYVQQRIQHLDIEEVVTAPRSPWQNPYAERVIGSLRRECLDHVIVLNERHLKRILSSYFAYYHTCRPHLSLERNAPQPRPIQPPDQGQVIALPQVGGLHHCYQRAA
jgi:transposase InsO family protein